MPNTKYAHKRRRNSKNFVAIPIEGNFPLGALAANALVSGNAFPAVLTEDFFALSVDLQASITGLTAGEGDPQMCGFSHADYSNTELEENLEVSFLGPGDKIAQERARRLVRKTGSFETDNLSQTKMNLVGRQGGRITRTKLKFVVNSGKNLDIWNYNKSGIVLTTGATLRFLGTVYGRWIL